MEKLEPNAAADNQDLLDKYIKPLLAYEGNPVGAAQMVGTLAHGLGAQSLAGWNGIKELLQGHGADAASGAVDSTAKRLGPTSLGAAGIDAVKSVAPIYRGIAEGPIGQASNWLGDKYGEGVSADADLAGKYLGETAGGLTQAAGAVAPMLAGPGEAEAGVEARSALPSHFAPLLEDGAHAGTLEREAAANARRAQDGIPVGDVPPSEFAGRQAEHEGTVAQRMKTPRQISAVPAPDSHLAGSVPDDATVYTSTHPETGEIQGHVVAVPRNGGMQMIDAQVDPEYQRQGIGTDLLHSAVADAHGQGLPLHSDTSVSVPQMANVHHSGHSVTFNPHIEEGEGPYGPALNSRNGQPVYSIHPPSAPEDAAADEPTQGSWVASQAYAKGGEVGTALGGLGDLIKAYAPLKGMPAKATIPGMGTMDVGPNQSARDAAAAYMKEAGLPYHPPSQYAQVDPARAKQIAAAFDAMPHAPDDPKVKASYDAMIRETLGQYQHMKNAGLNVEFMPPGADPYAASPRLMAKDVAENNHMYVYPTDAGFGSAGEDISGNPLLAQSGENFGGVPATHNDIFRAVHDYFGHAKEGVGFRANGEENAWRQHAGMYSDAARPAMTTETRGQNSWLNYGPHGDTNRTATTANTIFAPQKTGLLPDEFNSLDDPELHFLHMSNLSTPEVTLDPAYYGTGIKGAEARRGGTKTTSLYPADIDPASIEHGLESKTPYRVSVPAENMYNLNTDHQGFRGANDDFSDVEDAIKEAGYAGYHVPEGQGLFKGQGRLFQPTPATRLGPGPAPEAEEDLSAGFADGGGVEAGPLLSGLGDMVAKYAPEAEHLSNVIADKGGVTYNPTSGDIHTSGYAVPTQASRSVALDAPPTPDDLHDYMMTHQDAFDEDPNAALHVHSSGKNHFMHVAHVNPDFGAASDIAAQNGLPGFQDILSGEIHPANSPAHDLPEPAPADPAGIEQYLSGPARTPTPWTPGKQTVANPKRNAFPGIYGDPRQVISDATSKVGPEDPLLQQLFGVSRSDLSDLALSRQGNELGSLPGAKQNPTGAAAAHDVMTPKNAQRLTDVLGEARNSPELYKGMTGWYAMDPLYSRFQQMYGDEEAPARFNHFITLMGMASPGSDVGTEIARGTSAHWLNNEGRFQDFLKYAGGVDSGSTLSAPEDMAGIPGHPYHRTAQGIPMQQYLTTGSVQMKSPKVPPYIRASGVPETGFQTDLPVGDAHFARGIGLADTRGATTSRGEPTVPASSVTTPEMQTLAPWWKERVAAQAGLESVPAQALAWGAFSPYTGVKSAIGAPKLEILSSQIGKLAQRLGISPETARDMVISGKAGAFSHGGHV